MSVPVQPHLFVLKSSKSSFVVARSNEASPECWGTYFWLVALVTWQPDVSYHLYEQLASAIIVRNFSQAQNVMPELLELTEYLLNPERLGQHLHVMIT